MNEAQMQALLKLAADRLHVSPEQLRAAAERGDLSSIAGHANNLQAAQLKKLLSDPKTAEKLLAAPAAQKLLNALKESK